MLKISALVGFVVIAAVLGFFYFKPFAIFENKKTSTPKTLEKVRIGNIGEYSIFNLIAKEKGFFADNGIDAEIKEYSSGPAAITGMQAGEVDINIAADFVVVRNIFANPDIRILAHANQHRVFQLAGRKDLGIEKPLDLKGKKIGVTKNSAGEFFLGDFLTSNGLTLADVKRVDLPPADMIAQLEEGKIDAVSLFEPHIYKLKQKKDLKLTIWEIQGHQNINALVCTTKTFIDKNPDLIKRYISSLQAAENYYKAHPEEVKEFIAKKLNYDKAYIDYSWPRFTHEIGLKQELILNLETEARWAIANSLTDKKEVPNYLDHIYFKALEEVSPESITIIR